MVSDRVFADAEEHLEVVVSETAARGLWPGENPIGKRLREVVWKIDRQVAVPDVLTIQRVVSESLAERRFQTALLMAFAAIALLLAAFARGGRRRSPGDPPPAVTHASGSGLSRSRICPRTCQAS